ncbi:phage antirepressor KilAC domain-containing protein [Jeotgalibaca porci]|uniref:phage antirepressor KilAC domain-containing protein n=1 Tax=Jeotgalibaca porci TaxID=1868793 RepID=UPI00359FE916
MQSLMRTNNPLINLHEQDDGSVAVSGRELHEFLEIGTRYDIWLTRMTEYGFEENIDYITIAQKRTTAQGNLTNYVDHILTVDMAKEVSMIQRNEKGKQARQYFLQVEKAWNSPEMIMKRALQIADRKMSDMQLRIEADKPKVLFADSVSASHTSILVGDLAKLIKQNGVDIGANRLFTQLRDTGFLIKRKGNDWNMPTQRSMDMELFEIKESTHNNPDGSIRITRTPKVTGKGQVYFVNKYLNEVEL